VKLTIDYAPPIDREKLLVRINKIDKPTNISWYDYIQLKVITSGKAIVCKLHGNDIPEIKNRQASLIHINEPLRGKLGAEVGDTLDFDIKKATRWLAWYYFVRYHPNDIVRVSTWLAIIAILISIILGCISIVT